MSNQNFYTKHAQGVTVILGKFQRSVSSDLPTYPAILEALRRKDWAAVEVLTDIRASLAHASKLAGTRIRVEGDSLVYVSPGGEEHTIQGDLVNRAVTALNNGATAQTILPLMRFMDNIGKNRLKSMRDELYQFMAAGQMPITEDGCFLAYKRVDGNFKDCYTHMIDNSPGKLVQMDASKVDTNRHELCSTGLHFCARSYLTSYSGEKTVIVKVNPRHVFAIPTDYDFAKGRASEYFVVGECVGNPDQNELFRAPYVFDETKVAAVTEIEFIPSMKAGVVAMAEGYGLVADKKVLIAVANTKGPLEGMKRFVVQDKDGVLTNVLTGKPVKEENTKMMSVDTKSVRPLLVRAVARCRSRV